MGKTVQIRVETPFNMPITQTYVTDTHQWICGCPYYLTSRFGICKHLVQVKGAVTSEFFNNVKRNCTPPFLTVDNNQVPAEVQMESISCSNDIENNVEESTENSLETYDELISHRKCHAAIICVAKSYDQ